MSLDINLPEGVVAEEEKDVIGGGANILESGVYPGVMELVYLSANAKGTKSVTAHFKKKTDEQVVKVTTYISTKEDAAGNVRYTYTDKQSGDTKPLPGYSQVNAMFLALTGKPFSNDQPAQEKVINLYDFMAKEDVPTKVTVFSDTLNKPIAVGILRVSEEKTTAESNYKQGTGEFRDYNEFDKYFNAAGLTTTEITAGLSSPVFLPKWKEKNTGVTRIKKAKISNVGGATNTAAKESATPVVDPFAT